MKVVPSRIRTLSDRLTEAGGFRTTTVAVALLLVARTADIEWLHLAVHDWTSVVGHLRIGMQRQATRFGLPWPLPPELRPSHHRA